MVNLEGLFEGLEVYDLEDPIWNSQVLALKCPFQLRDKEEELKWSARREKIIDAIFYFSPQIAGAFLTFASRSPIFLLAGMGLSAYMQSLDKDEPDNNALKLYEIRQIIKIRSN